MACAVAGLYVTSCRKDHRFDADIAHDMPVDRRFVRDINVAVDIQRAILIERYIRIGEQLQILIDLNRTVAGDLDADVADGKLEIRGIQLDADIQRHGVDRGVGVLIQAADQLVLFIIIIFDRAARVQREHTGVADKHQAGGDSAACGGQCADNILARARVQLHLRFNVLHIILREGENASSGGGNNIRNDRAAGVVGDLEHFINGSSGLTNDGRLGVGRRGRIADNKAPRIQESAVVDIQLSAFFHDDETVAALDACRAAAVGRPLDTAYADLSAASDVDDNVLAHGHCYIRNSRTDLCERSRSAGVLCIVSAAIVEDIRLCSVYITLGVVGNHKRYAGRNIVRTVTVVGYSNICDRDDILVTVLVCLVDRLTQRRNHLVTGRIADKNARLGRRDKYRLDGAVVHIGEVSVVCDRGSDEQLAVIDLVSGKSISGVGSRCKLQTGRAAHLRKYDISRCGANLRIVCSHRTARGRLDRNRSVNGFFQRDISQMSLMGLLAAVKIKAEYRLIVGAAAGRQRAGYHI